MNNAITLGVRKGTDGKPVFEVLTDPNTPHTTQRRAFRALRRAHHGTYDEIQLWTSSNGRVKKQKTTGAPVSRTLPTQQSEPVVESAEIKIPGNSADGSGASPVQDKKAAGLAKARAAAAAKRASKSLLD